jgi:hypothetical protein
MSHVKLDNNKKTREMSTHEDETFDEVSSLVEELKRKKQEIEELEAKILRLQTTAIENTSNTSTTTTAHHIRNQSSFDSFDLPSVSASLTNIGLAGIHNALSVVVTPPAPQSPIQLSPSISSSIDISAIDDLPTLISPVSLATGTQQQSKSTLEDNTGASTHSLLSTDNHRKSMWSLSLKKVFGNQTLLSLNTHRSPRKQMLAEIGLLRKDSPVSSPETEEDSDEEAEVGEKFDEEIDTFWGMQVPVICQIYDGRVMLEKEELEKQQNFNEDASPAIDTSTEATEDTATSSILITIKSEEEDLTDQPEPKKEDEVDIQLFYDSDYLSLDNYENYIPDSPDNIEYTEEKKIKCGTVQKLIEKLTEDKQFDNQYLHAFLLTYRSFTTPHELIDRLINRYNITPENRETITSSEFIQWKKSTLDPIRLRVSQVIKTWITLHHYDFENDPQLVKKIIKLVLLMENTQGQAYAKQLRQIMDKTACFISDGSLMVTTRARGKSLIDPSELPKVKYPKNVKKYTNTLDRNASLESVSLFDWPTIEIARQLTLIEYRMFSRIEPKECLNQSWQEENNQTDAPNIFQMIHWFNRVSLYVATCIISCNAAKNRVKMIEKAIRLADECRKLKNYNAVFEVVSGLQNASVHRLKPDWAKINTTHKKTLESLLVLVSRDNNFRTLRSVIAHCEPPATPYLGMYLTDLTFIEDGNQDLLNNKINFLKRRKLATLIRDLQTYHQTQYKLQEVEQLREKWLRISPWTENELYSKSLQVYPRQQQQQQQ